MSKRTYFSPSLIAFVVGLIVCVACRSGTIQIQEVIPTVTPCPIDFGVDKAQATLGHELIYTVTVKDTANERCRGVLGLVSVESGVKLEPLFAEATEVPIPSEQEIREKYQFEVELRDDEISRKYNFRIEEDISNATVIGYFQSPNMALQAEVIPAKTTIFPSSEIVENVDLVVNYELEAGRVEDSDIHSITILNNSDFELRDATVKITIPTDSSQPVSTLNNLVEVRALNLGAKSTTDVEPKLLEDEEGYFGVLPNTIEILGETNIFGSCRHGCELLPNIFTEHIPVGNLKSHDYLSVRFTTRLVRTTPAP